MDKEMVGIRQATHKGYIECEIGGVADFSYPTSELRRGRVQGGGNICPTITSQSMGICRVEKAEGGVERNVQHDNPTVWGGLQEHQTPRKDGISPALTAAMGMGGGQTPIFAEKSVTAVDEQNMRIRTDTVGTLTTDGSTPKHNNRVLEIERSDCVAKIGQVSSEGSQCGSVYSDDGNMPTLTAGTHGDANSRICTEYRIRKLTPIECWRLMDFSDEDFHKAESVNSNTQLYKQAGNSIVVNVLVAILGQLFAGKEDVYKDCKVKREDANFFEENV